MATTKKINPVNANLPAPATSPKDELTSSVPYQSPVAAPAPKAPAPAPASKTRKTIYNPDNTFTIYEGDQWIADMSAAEHEAYIQKQQRGAGISQFNRELPATSEEKVAAVTAKQEATAKEFEPIESQIGQLTSQQQSDIQNAKSGENVGGAIITGGAGALAGGATAAIASGMAAGATAGLAGGPVIPITVPLGALAGAVIGILGKMRVAKKQSVTEAYGQYTTAKKNMGSIVAAARSTNPREHLDPMLAVEAWNFQYFKMLEAEQILKKETSNSLNSFLSGGQDELNNIEAWRQLEEQTHIYSNDLKSAIEGTAGVASADYSSPEGNSAGILNG